MKKWLVPTAVLASIFAAAAPAAAAPSGPPGPPVPTEFVSLNCGFEVNVELTGKVKNIALPDGRTVISTSPGLKVTLTGEESGKTLSYVITGVSFYTFLDDTIEVVSTGRNILLLPTPDGLYLTTGNVNYAIDYNFEEVRRFSGPGTATNICPLLAP